MRCGRVSYTTEVAQKKICSRGGQKGAAFGEFLCPPVDRVQNLEGRGQLCGGAAFRKTENQHASVGAELKCPPYETVLIFGFVENLFTHI